MLDVRFSECVVILILILYYSYSNYLILYSTLNLNRPALHLFISYMIVLELI
jgi:hypothetical protein